MFTHLYTSLLILGGGPTGKRRMNSSMLEKRGNSNPFLKLCREHVEVEVSVIHRLLLVKHQQQL